MSETIDKIKSRIIRRIKSLSLEKLKTLDNFLSQLEIEQNTKEEVLTFAGSFQDMEEDFFKELTTDLGIKRIISNRNT